ncbi:MULTISPECIES: hypothetical protein [Candidatus Ichthyocystis]|uniref:Uncharacterized protein n=1 Tax=Candidatus Ichthyocystis hellenicum TaxID=1561003 RepID=A0A0S4M456_9BURK|nr:MULTISPECIES: hypothetical protein [Ichthyocystis]CUT17791.1 hypothetical protein Ark11_0971 [Candidatus Ichthyocystis hellenicum]
MILSKKDRSQKLLPINQARIIHQQKIDKILSFIKDEPYTTISILQMLLKLKNTQSIKKIMIGLKSSSIVWEKTITISPAKIISIWGITTHGEMLLLTEQEVLTRITTRRKSRHIKQYQHTLTLQKIRILAHHAGWTKWINKSQSAFIGEQTSRVDAICTSPAGCAFAIEYERTLKNINRYRDIVGNRLQSIKRNEYQYIVWISDDLKVYKRLKKILFSIKYVVVYDTIVCLEKDKHLSKMLCVHYTEWPYIDEKISCNKST